MNTILFDRDCLLATIIIAVCAGTLSCRPSDAYVSAKGENKRLLLKEEIIDAANTAARKHGSDPPNCDIIYDEENVRWRQAVLETSPAKLENGRFVWPEGTFDKNIRRWPQLKGRDYQVVGHWHKSAVVNGVKLPHFEGGTWVAVDRNTGRVLSRTPSALRIGNAWDYPLPAFVLTRRRVVC